MLGTYPLRQNQIRIAIKRKKRELGRNTTFDEDMAFYESIPDTPELRPVRVIVYDNPFARMPFSKDLFRGPFDERWGVDGEWMGSSCGGCTLGRESVGLKRRLMMRYWSRRRRRGRADLR